MSQIVTAIYADGVLRPLAPLELPEQTEVEIEVREVKEAPDEAVEERRRIIEALAGAGLLANKPANFPLPGSPLSEAEEEELAELFADEKPLSEVIIEERREGY